MEGTNESTELWRHPERDILVETNFLFTYLMHFRSSSLKFRRTTRHLSIIFKFFSSSSSSRKFVYSVPSSVTRLGDFL